MKAEELERYARHLVLSEIGIKGQKRLLKSRVAIAGCGALSNVVANNLSRAGVGEIKIIDSDFVKLSDLQRQLFFTEGNIGQAKVKVLAERIKMINSAVEVIPIMKKLSSKNVEKIIKGSELVLDGLDNFESRFVVNDACIKNSLPWIYTAVLSTYGVTMNIIPGKTPCLRCLLKKLPTTTVLTTEQVGILNTVPVVMGSIESTEALKILLGTKPRDSLLLYDVWNTEFREIRVKRQKNCKCCGKREFEFLHR
ncbi:MAG: HesA/MoeB/ThiF family protein [Candidatus Thermoplasmatota archaeon]